MLTLFCVWSGDFAFVLIVKPGDSLKDFLSIALSFVQDLYCYVVFFVMWRSFYFIFSRCKIMSNLLFTALFMHEINSYSNYLRVYELCLIAALIFSAGYYSAPIFFLLRRIKKCFALPHFAAFSTFCVKSF